MRTAAPESALVLSTQSIDALRAVTLSASSIEASLQSISEEVQLRSRTELLVTLMERECDAGRAADLLCALWRSARSGDRAALRCLASTLEVRLSGVELLRRALLATQIARACRRAALGRKEAKQDTWREVLENAASLASRAGVQPKAMHLPQATDELRRRASSLLERLLTATLSEAELAWLVEFAEVEMRATAARLGDLAEKVGACDGRRISKLLPVLSKQEERIRDTRALLVRLPAPEDLVRRTPVLISRLEDRGFDGLVREVGSRPEGLELARALVLTSWRAPLAPELCFLASVVRLVAERVKRADKPPLDAARALLLALMTYRRGGLDVDLSSSEARATAGLWKALGIEPRPGGFRLLYDARRYEPMLAEDGVPELTYPIVRRTPDLRVLVMSNVQNEAVLCGLLAVPRVAALPGLVESVTIRSRSIKVLLEIANRRDLHTGAANRNVPKALLWHPTAIPVSALRKFVHVRFLDRGELAALCMRGSRARPEVRQLAALYLASLTTT